MKLYLCKIASDLNLKNECPLFKKFIIQTINELFSLMLFEKKCLKMTAIVPECTVTGNKFIQNKYLNGKNAWPFFLINCTKSYFTCKR